MHTVYKLLPYFDNYSVMDNIKQNKTIITSVLLHKRLAITSTLSRNNSVQQRKHNNTKHKRQYILIRQYYCRTDRQMERSIDKKIVFTQVQYNS